MRAVDLARNDKKMKLATKRSTLTPCPAMRIVDDGRGGLVGGRKRPRLASGRWLLLAFGLSSVIGLQRRFHGKNAGLRTKTIVRTLRRSS